MKNKGNLLAAFFAGIVFVTAALAAATKFTDLTVTGATQLNGTTTLGDASTDVTAMTGQFALQVSTAPRSTVVGITPSRAGTIIWNSSDNQLCISTGATKFTWVLPSSTSTACSH